MKTQHVIDEIGNDVYIKVSFPENELIMQDKEMVKDAFSVLYNTATQKAVILNEGFDCDYGLSYSEYAQIKHFYTTYKQAQHSKVA